MADLHRALVTGATRGIGRAVAETIAGRGYEVIVNYAHDETAARETVEAIHRDGWKAVPIKGDVTDADAVAHLFDDLLGDGPIDLLINNVGDFLFKPFLDTTPDEWAHVLRSNLTSAVLCCRAILPAMRSRGSGAIINIASMNAEILRAKPNTLPYAVANAGLVLLTKTLAATEGPFGIRVNAICPGFVETGDYPPADVARTIPLRRLGRASEIAGAVAFLASDEASYVTGAILNAHGGAFL